MCQIKEAQFQNVHYCMIPVTLYSGKDKTMWQRTDQWFSRSYEFCRGCDSKETALGAWEWWNCSDYGGCYMNLYMSWNS